ncbi:MAG TPA: IclR family transcriptional regulator [Novosphingobium sp.]|nr:IclR family transcriptional regulator [Novosphingobium sp.]HQA17636.1 IclR family transcriptional regulator [Novosphingobium sp.]
MATKQSTTLAKGLRLLQAILADGGRSTLSEIARQQGVPLPTAHRLSLTLEAEGFIERNEWGCFLPGQALPSPQVADQAPERRLALALRRSLRKLAAKHSVLVHFGILEDGMVTYLAKENGGGQELFTQEHMQLEAYCSGIGKVLLAALPDDELESYLANGPFVPLTPRTITTPEQLRRELVIVRDEGVAYDRFEVREDLFCVAIPVTDENDRVIAGMSASFLGQAPDPVRVRALRRSLLRLAAEAQSRA